MSIIGAVPPTLADLNILDHAIETTRRHIMDADGPKERMFALWAGAKHARHLAPAEEIIRQFSQLGRDVDLASGAGRKFQDDTLRHVIGWACQDADPFGPRGMLQ